MKISPVIEGGLAVLNDLATANLVKAGDFFWRLAAGEKYKVSVKLFPVQPGKTWNLNPRQDLAGVIMKRRKRVGNDARYKFSISTQSNCAAIKKIKKNAALALNVLKQWPWSGCINNNSHMYSTAKIIQTVILWIIQRKSTLNHNDGPNILSMRAKLGKRQGSCFRVWGGQTANVQSPLLSSLEQGTQGCRSKVLRRRSRWWDSSCRRHLRGHRRTLRQ